MPAYTDFTLLLRVAIFVIVTISWSFQTEAFSILSPSCTLQLSKRTRKSCSSVCLVNSYRGRDLNVVLSCSNDIDQIHTSYPESCSPSKSNIENNDDTYLRNLNKDQLAAVTANLRDIRVQAGPGSGKTR